MKLTELSPEQKRILAAEAYGFKFLQWNCKKLRGVSDSSKGYLVNVPDYGASLDAMHEAERIAWTGDLEKLHNDPKTYRQWQDYKDFLEYNIHATAAQRLDAFLLAKGLAE